jgi:hypothetical protein
MVPAPAPHLTRRGRIEYRTSQPGFPGGLWGFEDWRLTRHRDGTRVLRAYCELQDEPFLIRDVIQTVDRDFHPVEAFVRLTTGDRLSGSGWYRFTDAEARLHGLTAARGRIDETRSISRAMRGFGTHSLIADAWLCARFDYARGPGIQTFRDNLMTSTDHRGATGPEFTTTASSSLQYFGREAVDVRAGRIDCHHFAFVNTSHNHPPYDLWISADGDFLFVKGVVGAPYFWDFELVELG